MFKQYSLLDLLELQGKPEPIPVLTPCSEYYSQVMCQVCYSIKPNAMIIHRDCRRTFCVHCVKRCLESQIGKKDPVCPQCNNLMLDYGSESENMTRFGNIGPNEEWLYDNMDYQCSDCKEIMKKTQALTHPNTCDKTEKFKPPEYIHNWDDVKISRQETFSNPVVNEENKKPDRLLIYHHNGYQLSSKFVKAKWDIARVKLQISRLADCDANDIKLYKFVHEELDNDTLVCDIAKTQGATHITSTTKMDLKKRTIGLYLQDPGPPPRVENPNKRGQSAPTGSVFSRLGTRPTTSTEPSTSSS